MSFSGNKLRLAPAAIFVLLFAACFSAKAEEISPDNAVLLDSLDAVLARSDEYVRQKEHELADMKRRLAAADNPEQRFWKAKELTEAYSYYDSDSALVYADETLHLARAMQRPDWIFEIQITRGYVLAATGRFELATKAIREIEPARLQAQNFLPYYECKVSMQTMDNLYVPDGHDGRVPEMTVQMLDSISSLVPYDDPDSYWIRGWIAMRQDSVAAANFIPVLKQTMLGCTYSGREDARKAWMLATMYEQTGDHDNWLRYIILSSIADVRASVKEIASIQELATYLYNIGDLDRANNYISYALQCANSYKCRARISVLSQRQMEISKAFAERNDEQQRQLRVQMTWLSISLLLLLIAIVAIFAVMRKLRRRQRELDAANTDLSKNVEKLQTARVQLDEANQNLENMYERAREDARKLAAANDSTEKHIADIFSICSENIDRLGQMHTRISRLITAGQFDEVRKIAKSTELKRSELQDLYRNFDRIFLSIYPNFVEDFNTLLRPEEQITLKDDELLTTDLRIYALVRLGLNDSVRIARFLHCSAQTVYNIRLRMRKKAIVPREEFAEAVQRLGKPRF